MAILIKADKITRVTKIILELDEEEARFLRTVMERIAGDMHNSPRRCADTINEQLGSAGVEPLPGRLIDGNSSLRFCNYSSGRYDSSVEGG